MPPPTLATKSRRGDTWRGWGTQFHPSRVGGDGGGLLQSLPDSTKGILQGLKPVHSIGFIGIRRGGKSCPDNRRGERPRIEFFRSL
jgi:hypothetical protein